jgi:hypothetical protein
VAPAAWLEPFHRRPVVGRNHLVVTSHRQEQAVSTSTERRKSVHLPQTTFHRVKLLFLVAAFASLVLSVSLWFSGAREEGVFVGLWVPAIHSLGTLVLVGERDGLIDRGRL